MSHRLNKTEAFAALPPEWPVTCLPAIREHLKAKPRKLVVLDDDPTGTQTVYGTPVLTEWSIDSLRAALNDIHHQTFYILTNSRSLPTAEAQTLNREIGQNLKTAAEQVKQDFAVVSRSDSTLRGHFPAEVEALVEAIGQSFDAWLIIPYFLEGGRYTLNDIHYVAEGDDLIPAADTPFAQDAAFGYQFSNLCEWVAEKTVGRVSVHDVASISIPDIREGGPAKVAQKLLALDQGAICIINAISPRDMEVFVSGLLAAEAQGKTFLYRTAASFVQTRAGLASRPLLTSQELALSRKVGGLIVAGSYVPKTTEQIETLLAQTNVIPYEVSVETLLDDAYWEYEIRRISHQVSTTLAEGDGAIIYTSRQLISGSDPENSLAIGRRISDSLVKIVRSITTRPRYLIAKGGITSSDVATQGLGIKRAMVAGQIIPGVPVWQAGSESRWPGLTYVVFPGNVGGADGLAQVVNKFEK